MAKHLEWDVPGWRIDPNAPGASFGIIMGVTRCPGSSVRIRARGAPRLAVTFGWVHTLSENGDDNAILLRHHCNEIGFSDPEFAREAMEAFRAGALCHGATVPLPKKERVA